MQCAAVTMNLLEINEPPQAQPVKINELFLINPIINVTASAMIAVTFLLEDLHHLNLTWVQS